MSSCLCTGTREPSRETPARATGGRTSLHGLPLSPEAAPPDAGCLKAPPSGWGFRKGERRPGGLGGGCLPAGQPPKGTEGAASSRRRRTAWSRGPSLPTCPLSPPGAALWGPLACTPLGFNTVTDVGRDSAVHCPEWSVRSGVAVSPHQVPSVRSGPSGGGRLPSRVCVFQVLSHLHKKLKNVSKTSEASKRKVRVTDVRYLSLCRA